VSGDTLTRLTRAPEETEALGAAIARLVPDGSVVALTGDLGAGKTCLVRGIVSTVSTDATVTSPTFTIVHEYRGDRAVYHLDLYRIGDPAELTDLGYEELFSPPDGISVVEWAERAEGLLPARRVDVALEHMDPMTRRVVVINRECLGRHWTRDIENAVSHER